MDTQEPKESKTTRTTMKCAFCGKGFPPMCLTPYGKYPSGTTYYKCKRCYGDQDLPLLPEDSVTETEKTPLPERTSIEEPEMVKVSCDDPIVEAVVKKLRDRSRVGVAKYGTKLDRTDLTALQWMQHLQEELMDAANYLERLMHDYRQAQVIFDAIHKLNKP